MMSKKEVKTVGWSIAPDQYSCTLLKHHIAASGKYEGEERKVAVGWYKDLHSAKVDLVDILMRNGMYKEEPITPEVAEHLLKLKEDILDTLKGL